MSDHYGGLPDFLRDEVDQRAMKIEEELAGIVADGMSAYFDDRRRTAEAEYRQLARDGGGTHPFLNTFTRSVAERIAALDVRLSQLEDRADVEDACG